MTFRILAACLTFFTFNSKTFAQDVLKIAEEKDSKRDSKMYTIKSLDGRNQKVNVLPDYGNRILRITCLKDTISINDYWGVPPEVSILNKTFIKIKYAVRGGSNLALGNVMIVCVNRFKLYEAMHVNEYVTSETSGEYSTYNAKLTLTGNNKWTFKVSAKVHDIVRSKEARETNYNYDQQSVLHFDEKRNVFYSIKKNIYDSFLLEGEKSKKQIRGNFPVIILGDVKYCYINNKWLEMNICNRLKNI